MVTSDLQKLSWDLFPLQKIPGSLKCTCRRTGRTPWLKFVFFKEQTVWRKSASKVAGNIPQRRTMWISRSVTSKKSKDSRVFYRVQCHVQKSRGALSFKSRQVLLEVRWHTEVIKGWICSAAYPGRLCCLNNVKFVLTKRWSILYLFMQNSAPTI